MIDELLKDDEDDTSDGRKRNRRKSKPKKETVEKEAYVKKQYHEYNAGRIDEMHLIENLSVYTSSANLVLRKWK